LRVSIITVILVGMKEYNNSNPNFNVANYSTWSRASSEDEKDWRDKAACKDIDDPELFFPVGNTGPALIQIEKAKSVCNTCISREECLGYAMVHNQDSGVWGGLSEDERRGLKRRSSRRAASAVIYRAGDLN